MKKTLYVLACTLCTLLVLPAAAQVPSYVPTDGLVGWWPFNGNANDESGNGNDGVVNGATLAEDRLGSANSAYGFDGVDDFIEVAHSVSLNLLPITLSIWFNVDSLSNGQWLVGKYTCASGNGYSAHLLSGKPSAFYYSGNTDANRIDLDNVSSNYSNIPNETWHQAVLVFDSVGLSYYVDGSFLSFTEFIGDGDSIGDPTNTTAPLMFGRYLEGGCFNFPSEYFFLTGILDDIAIYNRALTESEIQSLYTGQCPTVSTNCTSLPSNLQQGLVGYWPFCGNANDESGNGNDGVVNGATLTEDRFGNANAAYGFDGVDDFINCGGVNELNLESVSVSIWANENSFPDTRDHTFFSKGAFGNGEIGYRATVNQNQRSYFIWSVDPFGSDYVESANSNDLGDWHHYIFSKDQDTMRIFIDGILDSELIHPRSPLNNSSPFLIGGNRDFTFPSPSYVDFWFGSLDDIGIWNRALTPEEVQELYTLDACTFTVYDTLTVYETVYDTVYTYETIYDTVTTYVTVTDTLLIDITFTGIEGQPSWLNTVTVFPNPASDHITIDYGNFALMAGYNTIITDAAGATVYSSAVNAQQVEIDINAWGATGVYYMSVYDASGELVAVRHIVLE